MKSVSLLIVGALSFSLLQGCQQQAQTRQLDINGVMDRTIEAIIDFTADMETSNPTISEAEALQSFTSYLHKALNKRPNVFTGTLGLTSHADASFDGFDDLNRNNVQDNDEQYLFKLEIDTENERLIATDFSETHHGTTFRNGQYRGFFLGYIGSRQASAGVDPKRFAGKSIDTRMKPVRTASNGQMRKAGSARSKARSGGARSGK